MKKFLSLLVALSFLVTLIPPMTFAAEKTGKELAAELVENPKAWEAFSKEQKDAVSDFAKEDSKRIKETIDKVAGTNASITAKEKVLENLWAKLSKEEQLAYLVYLTPAEWVETEETGITSEGEGEFTALANSKNFFKSTYTATNLYGIKLFAYSTQNEWYYDGVKIYSISPKETPVIYESGWSYNSKYLEAWYEYNNFDYNRNVDGFFQLSIVMTWQKATVFFDTKVRANGDWTVWKGRTSGWTN